jgi:hypothetical protein
VRAPVNSTRGSCARVWSTPQWYHVRGRRAARTLPRNACYFVRVLYTRRLARRALFLPRAHLRGTRSRPRSAPGERATSWAPSSSSSSGTTLPTTGSSVGTAGGGESDWTTPLKGLDAMPGKPI